MSHHSSALSIELMNQSEKPFSVNTSVYVSFLFQCSLVIVQRGKRRNSKTTSEVRLSCLLIYCLQHAAKYV